MKQKPTKPSLSSPGCTRKSYLTEQEALGALNAHNEVHQANGWKKAKGVYKCVYCKLYHITTTKASRGKQQRKWHKLHARWIRRNSP